jgi:hypothetical protein
VKIIDRAKAYIQEKKGRDRRSTGNPLDGAADAVPAQHDGGRHKQNRDDKGPAVSTAHETPEPEPATEPAAEPTIESATEPTMEPATEPAAEPITEPAHESATAPATAPATESATDPITEPAIEPAMAPATEPTMEPATGPTTAPAACPRCGATGEAPCTTPSGKATKNHKGREQ